MKSDYNSFAGSNAIGSRANTASAEYDNSEGGLLAALFSDSQSPKSEVLIDLQQEIETKFVVRTKRLMRELESKKLRCERITQAYIPPELIPTVLMLCHPPSRGSYLELIDDPYAFSCARVRNSTTLNGQRKSDTVLQLKGPRVAKVKRNELSIRLSQEEFFRALSYATDGAMEKIRFTHYGHVIDRGGQAHRAVAHIDFIIAAGPPNALELSPYGRHVKHPFAFVDIEVPKLGLIQRLERHEKHSFNYLRRSISLLKEEAWLRKATRTRTISRLGFRHKLVRSAFKELESRCP